MYEPYEGSIEDSIDAYIKHEANGNASLQEKLEMEIEKHFNGELDYEELSAEGQRVVSTWETFWEQFR